MIEDIHVGATTFSQPTDTQLIATRTLDATRELVWAVHTQCEHVAKWLLGPAGWSMPVCEIDLRPGGAYRYVYEGPDEGFEFNGVFREIQPLERIVNTERMNDNPVETLNTLTLTEQEGVTVVRTVVDYPSKEVREEIIATGMLDGWGESFDALQEYLNSIK